ncbi:Glutathione gamma-glutamylcysteinyltransferase [Schistosoma japonicum]|nr:Glutathione gamma-glutamylcysteinyltransferase [Schistosoma japonicum]
MNATQSFPEFYKSLKLGRIWSTFGVIKFSQIFGRLFLLNRQIYSFHNSVPLVKSNIILLSSIQSMSSSCNTTKFHTDVTSGVQQFYRRPLPRHCIPFSSPEGKRIFREALLSGHMETYFCLASQFCTQEEPSYCGLASLVMVLNALGIDPGRVWKSPWRWYHESMLTCCLPQDVLTKGITLDDFVRIARCYGLDAYSSPSALLDPHSTGYKLKSLVNLWVSWLKCDSEIFADLPAHFLYEALTFLFDEIDRLKPTSFFFVIHPLTSSLPDGNELNNIDGELVNFSTHDILRDIVGSSLGRIVTDFMLKMNQEYFAWLTTDGTFRLTIPTPDSWTKRTDDCPFTVLSDPGLRFCLLTTSFLLAFPYDLFISNSLLFNNSVSSHLSSPTSSKSRLQIMKKSIDDVKLLPATYAELHSLRNLLKSLMNVNDNLSCTRCINH